MLNYIKAKGMAVLAGMTGICLFCSCESNNAGSDEGGGILSSLRPSFLGGKKNAEAEEPAEPEKPAQPMPTKFPIGSIHVVRADEKFVLVKSSKTIHLESGTELMTYALDGKPTSKLSLSPERKGSYVVADIVQGNPKKGDRVVAMGVTDSTSPTTRGLVPALGGDSDVQVLE